MEDYDVLMAQHRTRKPKPSEAILWTTTSGATLALSQFIDVLVYLSILPILSITLATDRIGLLWLYLLPVGLQLFLTMFAGGMTVGFWVTGLRYLHQQTYRLFRGGEMLSYAFGSFWDRFKYHDLYEAFALYSDPHHQTPSMKRYGVLVVEKRLFRKFLDDYLEDGRIVETSKKINRTMQSQHSGAIFKDE